MRKSCNSSALSPLRRALILGTGPSQLLDSIGPAEILAQAGHLRGREAVIDRPPLYAVSCLIVAESGSPTTSAGLPLRSTVGGGEGARCRRVEPEVRALTRRALLRHLGVPPGNDRNRFRTRHPSGVAETEKVLHA